MLVPARGRGQSAVCAPHVELAPALASVQSTRARCAGASGGMAFACFAFVDPMLFPIRNRERGLPITLARLLCGIPAVLLLLATAASAGPFLVKDINPGEGCDGTLGSGPYWGIKVGESLFFSACGAYQDCQLWKSDGTPANTAQVSHIVTTDPHDSCPMKLTEVDGRVFFITGGWFLVEGEFGFEGEFGYGYQLWVSDGTGTVPVTDPPDFKAGGGDLWSFADLTEMAGHLFFTASDGTSRELWRSDGTASGTVPLTSFGSWKDPENFDSRRSWDLTQVNGTLFFSRCQKATGCELWKSDGTAAGTVRVAVITPPGNYEDSPLDEGYPWALVEFTPLDDRLFFQACTGVISSDTATNCELWGSDGSETGTVRVTPFYPDIPNDPDFGGRADYSEMAAANGRVFFRSCQPDASGDWSCGLWRSDGTPGGTVEMLGHFPWPSWPENFASVGGTLFFRSGGNIWRSHGTAAGTVSLGMEGSGWTEVRGTLFFDRYDPVSRNSQLWRSDGTDAGTFALTDLPAPTSILAEAGGTLFLNVDDQERGRELFGLALCGGEPAQCDPVTGECAGPPWGCDDGNPCTADACDPGVGCTHTPIDECLLGVILADVSVLKAESRRTFGRDDVLRLDRSSPKQTFIRVQVTGLGTQPPLVATLRLQVAKGQSAASKSGGRIHLMKDCSWNERTMTWKNRPAIGTDPLDTQGAVLRGQVVDFDVTEAILGDGVYCFALDSRSSDGVEYHSREAAAGPPQLLITPADPARR